MLCSDNEYFHQGNRHPLFSVLYEKLNVIFLWAVRVLGYNLVTVKLSSVWPLVLKSQKHQQPEKAAPQDQHHNCLLTSDNNICQCSKMDFTRAVQLCNEVDIYIIFMAKTQ